MTEEPAATTFDQSKSDNEDSEKMLKFFWNSPRLATVAGEP